MTRALIFGNSYTHCLRVASLKWGDRFNGLDVRRLGTAEEAAAQPHVETVDSLIELMNGLEDVPLFVSLGGTFHNTVGLLQSGPQFDFIIDQNDRTLSQSSTIVPSRALKSWFSTVVRGNGSVLRLRAAARSEVYVLASPPPKQSNAYLADRAARRREGGARGLSVRQMSFTRPEVRLRLWQLEQTLVREWVDELGMIYVPVPSAAFNDDGFLARRYYATDLTHANTEYGLVTMGLINTILAGSKEKRVHV